MKKSDIICGNFRNFNKYGCVWFRIFGRGLKIKDTTISPLFFSERNGYTKGIKIGKWYIGYLPKDGH